MGSVPINRARALIICHEPPTYAPSRVSEAAAYLLQSSVSSEDEGRLATEAIEWLRGKRDEKPAAKTEQVSEPKPAPAKQKPKGRNAR